MAARSLGRRTDRQQRFQEKIFFGKTVNYNFDSMKDNELRRGAAIKPKDLSMICLINCL
jgi:hypothetical protein